MRLRFVKLAVLIALCCASAVAQSTTRESVASSGAQIDPGCYSASRVSAQGRYVVFATASDVLSDNDTNGVFDVFVRDRWSATTTRVSADPSGAAPNGSSANGSISADGRFVSFESGATNLVPSSTPVVGVYLYDRTLGVTERVSVSTLGGDPNGASRLPSISADGRFVAFESEATNLVPGDSNGTRDVFVRDRQLGTTERVSIGAGGIQSDGSSDEAVLSPDGRFVSFTSAATNLVVGDTNGFSDVFLRDRSLGVTERISVSSAGAQGNRASSTSTPSADGRFVVFSSEARNLVPGDTNFRQDVFLRDRRSGTTARLSVGATGAQLNDHSSRPTLTPDARYVAWESNATNVVPGDTSFDADVFVLDRHSGSVDHATLNNAGADVAGNWPSLSADGRLVVFNSSSSSIVFDDTNGTTDVFARDRSGSGVGFCFGDGSGAACPCGNIGATLAGCSNSSGSSGRLETTGSASIGVDSLVVHAFGVANGSVLFFQGTARVNAGLGSTFGDGLRCAGGVLVRLSVQSPVGGAARYPNPGDPAMSVRGAVVAGAKRTYQAWSRDVAPFCTSDGFNTTNGFELTWEP